MSKEDFVKFWQFMKIFMPDLEVKYKEFIEYTSFVFITNRFTPCIRYFDGEITYLMHCIKCDLLLIDTNENPIYALGYCLDCGAKIIEYIIEENTCDIDNDIENNWIDEEGE
jgi:hypothetical protein